MLGLTNSNKGCTAERKHNIHNRTSEKINICWRAQSLIKVQCSVTADDIRSNMCKHYTGTTEREKGRSLSVKQTPMQAKCSLAKALSTGTVLTLISIAKNTTSSPKYHQNTWLIEMREKKMQLNHWCKQCWSLWGLHSNTNTHSFTKHTHSYTNSRFLTWHSPVESARRWSCEKEEKMKSKNAFYII